MDSLVSYHLKRTVEFLSPASLILPALCIPAADERRAWRQAQFGGRDELSEKTKKKSFSSKVSSVFFSCHVSIPVSHGVAVQVEAAPHLAAGAVPMSRVSSIQSTSLVAKINA